VKRCAKHRETPWEKTKTLCEKNSVGKNLVEKNTVKRCEKHRETPCEKTKTLCKTP
jgi:hypothetical protein